MKAVLVICEGRSDIAFVRRSLLAGIPECERFNRGIGSLYTPFGANPPSFKTGVIARYIEKCFRDHPADSRKLAGATILPRPQFDAAVINTEKDIIYLFVDSGGRDQHKAVINLLKFVDAPFKSLGISKYLDVKEYATAFLFDANDRGKENVIEDFRTNYCDHFGCLVDVGHKCWAESDRCPVGLYICCNEEGNGALENYIIEMTRLVWPKRHMGANDFICQNKEHGDKILRSETNKLKAIITSVGQFDFPGDSLFSIINDENKGIPDERFGKLSACKDLVKFLQDISWEN